MKILIITHVIFPYQSPRAFRSTELAKELAKRGHIVTMYANTGDLDYSDFQREYNLSIKSFRKLIFIRKNSSSEDKYTFLDKVLIKIFRRILYYPNIEYLFNIKKSLKYESGYDLMISIASPHSIHWGCTWALKRNNKLCNKWIADCGDPFMGNKFEAPPAYFSFLEKWFCKRADAITIPIETARNAYFKEFRNKIYIIPQGFNFDNVKVFSGEISNPVISFAYAGALYKNDRDPKIFIEYLCTLDIDFRFIIYTTEVSLVEPYKKRLGVKLQIRPYIKRDELIFELSKMDFLVNIENKHKVHSPSKLIDYALTKRPVLCVGTEEINMDSIQAFLHKNYSKKLSVDLDKYKIENVAERFIDLALKQND